jgi:hypothetical protein
MRQRNMNSYFIQRDGGRLYDTTNMGHQEYGPKSALNGSKPYVPNLMRTFLASLAKYVSKLLSAFHASPSDGCTMTLLFSRTPSMCHLMCLPVPFEINNRVGVFCTSKIQGGQDHMFLF